MALYLNRLGTTQTNAATLINMLMHTNSIYETTGATESIFIRIGIKLSLNSSANKKLDKSITRAYSMRSNPTENPRARRCQIHKQSGYKKRKNIELNRRKLTALSRYKIYEETTKPKTFANNRQQKFCSQCRRETRTARNNIKTGATLCDSRISVQRLPLASLAENAEKCVEANP